MHFSIQKGLDLPLSGEPIQTIEAARHVTSVAILGNEYNGMKPTMLVEEGQSIKLGQALSTRKDLIEPSYITPLSRLQDNVQPFSSKVVDQTIQKTFGKPASDIFKTFS
ncbi:MAG: NADH:ubiquinone reductase (Na(+)-transporting) subunit A, partial [Piscirickettsiaceae bacterium]|nr:NADH:ubiquinone reductase (Na(+)-transporting) subunit A [Piscirickettsiaceae bacterium]